MMDDYIKRVRNYLRIGVQEAYLCSEFSLKYLEKDESNVHLSTVENLVKNYCILDKRLQIQPDILSKMTQEENEKLVQRENSENPDNTIPNYDEIFSGKLMDAIKNTDIENHGLFQDFKKKMEKLANTTNGTGNDDELMVTDESNSLVDPISKQELVDPVISIRCKHRFSRKTATEHLKGKYASQCPYVGCKQKFSREDLEDDVIASQTLYRMRLLREI